jgi:nucleoside recognition membrane protein YjiH
LGTVASGTAFFASVGVVLYTYTPIFDWFGYIFWPFMKISIPDGQEALLASKAHRVVP